jgi:hypothetical protein
MRLEYLLAWSVAGLAPLAAQAQQPIAYVPTDGVTVSGSLQVANGKATIGNNGSVTAGDKTATITLARGGELHLCTSTAIHLTTDQTVSPDSTGLMLALDRGALEASYKPGNYSDVLLTPDLRILVSGPGDADFKLRVNAKGDTCIDNHGDNAPYITVTSQFEGGIYRVKPNQRVLFEHGSLQQVVDNESEPCGCPPAVPVAIASDQGKPVGGPSSTPADTAFPLAESEGLKPPPAPPSQPVVPAGQPHAQVDVPLTYSGATNQVTPAPSEPPAEPLPPAPAAQTAETASPAPEQKPNTSGSFFHHVGHFFARLFGRG